MKSKEEKMSEPPALSIPQESKSAANCFIKVFQSFTMKLGQNVGGYDSPSPPAMPPIVGK